MRKSSILLGAAFSLFLLTVGCYTVLNHPSDVAMTAQVEDEDVAVPCGDCHYESEWLGYYDHPLIYGWGGYYAYDSWYDYYRRPWWFDDYWYGGYHSGGSYPTVGGQSSWEKRDLRRGDTSETSSPVIYPGTSRPPGGTGSSAAPSSGSQETKEKKQAEPTHRKKEPRR